jgi:alpha-beta hydrolase superfamily lysophospholipase
MRLFLDDRDFDAQLQRTLIAVAADAADTGETLATAARVTPGDYGSWFTEWEAPARRAQERARAARAKGHRVSARQGFLRATEYFRQAIFFVRADLDDPRLQSGWRAHRAAFEAAIPLLDHEVVTGDVACGDARLRAYLCRPPGAKGDVPVVFLPCGFDSTAEAGYVATAYMALKRGWAALLFEGPGQGGALYDQRVAMRPDFENVVRPIVDWTLAQGGVDPARLAMFGRSFGGYLAPRAVSGETRFAALVCDPGQYEFVSRVVGSLFDEAAWRRVLAGERDDELETLRATPHKAEYFGARMATMGAKTVGEFLRLQPLYTLEGRAQHIRCPTLVVEGEGDFASQSALLASKLVNAKTTHVTLLEKDGAGGHCAGMGATTLEETVFDWLQETLR